MSRLFPLLLLYANFGRLRTPSDVFGHLQESSDIFRSSPQDKNLTPTCITQKKLAGIGYAILVPRGCAPFGQKHNLWEGPTLEVRDSWTSCHSAHAQSKSDKCDWLKIQKEFFV